MVVAVDDDKDWHLDYLSHEVRRKEKREKREKESNTANLVSEVHAEEDYKAIQLEVDVCTAPTSELANCLARDVETAAAAVQTCVLPSFGETSLQFAPFANDEIIRIASQLAPH